jgi:hypothetical protein
MHLKYDKLHYSGVHWMKLRLSVSRLVIKGYMKHVRSLSHTCIMALEKSPLKNDHAETQQIKLKKQKDITPNTFQAFKSNRFLEMVQSRLATCPSYCIISPVSGVPSTKRHHYAGLSYSFNMVIQGYLA